MRLRSKWVVKFHHHECRHPNVPPRKSNKRRGSVWKCRCGIEWIFEGVEYPYPNAPNYYRSVWQEL